MALTSFLPSGYDDSVLRLVGPPPIPFGSSDAAPALRSPAPGSLGPLDATYDEGVRYQTFTNDRCHMTFADGEEETDLCHNTLLFSHFSPQVKAVDRQFMRLRNLSMLNCHLATQAGRQRYAGTTHGADILREWRPVGFQQTNTDAPGVTRRLGEMHITVAVSHKARVPNLWLALGDSMNVGDELWLLLRRLRFYATNPISGAPEWDGTYYWRFEPYVSRDGLPPPARLYTDYGADDALPDMADQEELGTRGWTGAALYIGRISEFYGDQTAARWQRLATEALFPARPNNDFKERLAALPVVELMYLV